MIPQDLLDAAVEAKLHEFLQGDDSAQKVLAVRQAGLEQQLKDAESRRSRASTTLEGLEDQVRRLNRDYRAGTLSAALYEENRREIERDREQLQSLVAEVRQEEESITRQMREQESLSHIFELAGKWSELDVPKRKMVLRNLLHHVVAYKPARSREVTAEVVWKFAEPAIAQQ